MLIEKGQLFADMLAKDVRDALRNAGGKLFTRPSEITEAAWAKILDDGLATLSDDPEDGGRFCLEIAGFALVNARCGKPITRKKADNLLAGLAGRAADLNADPEIRGSVVSLQIFGSYLGESDALGDVDLIVELETDRQFIARLPVAEMLSYEDKMIRRLKGGSAFLSFHYACNVPEPAREAARLFWSCEKGLV